ncbi:hypothetical protein TAMA11512_10490 [Selenomonas sp. TAMA-11512]|uniref:hypothetical protein n=1 Tax=Selenomonas sp. TAMA-11512 TaxID=3095337 RepID=UPI0030865FB9|nr:hypothetical protein TAMA11512_10490 [Selenomonas sp. TAMA-11512]
MIGMVDIHINKEEQNFLLQVLHKNKIGFGECIGDLREVSYEELAEAVQEGLKTSLKYYKVDVEASEPWKKTKYRSWKKFYSRHELLSVSYNTEETEEKRYEIFLWEKELTRNAYTTPKKENMFYLSQEEFETKFYTVFDTLRSRIEE